MAQAVRYIRVFATVLVGILGAVAAVNVFVDPYAVNRLLNVTGLNDQKPGEWEHARLRKPFDLWRGNYDAIALGTSQVERGIDPGDPALRQNGIRLYNAGLSEERPFEQAILLRFAAQVTDIKFAIVSLDFLRYIGAGGQPEFLSRTWTRWDAMTNYLETLISIATLWDSMKTLAASQRHQPTLQHHADGLLNVEDLFAKIGQPDYRRVFDVIDGSYLNGAYAPMLTAREKLEHGGLDHSDLKDMLKTAHQHGVKLYFFITPSHARQAEIVNFLGLESLYERWIGELVCLLANDALEEPNRQAFPLWDFSGYNPVTTERLPPTGSQIRMRWYNDPVHYTYRTGWAILDRILNLSAPGSRESGDFGEEVTLGTVEQHFDKRQQERQRYLDAHPEIYREVEALYHGPPPGAGESPERVPGGCEAVDHH
jgi:hypothetical protein